MEHQLADRESAGITMRMSTAHFLAVKTLEDFNLDHLPSLRRDMLAHLATGMFVPKAENVILLGPPITPGSLRPSRSPRHHGEVLTRNGDSYRTRTRRELLGKNRSTAN